MALLSLFKRKMDYDLYDVMNDFELCSEQFYNDMLYLKNDFNRISSEKHNPNYITKNEVLALSDLKYYDSKGIFVNSRQLNTIIKKYSLNKVDIKDCVIKIDDVTVNRIKKEISNYNYHNHSLPMTFIYDFAPGTKNSSIDQKVFDWYKHHENSISLNTILDFFNLLPIDSINHKLLAHIRYKYPTLYEHISLPFIEIFKYGELMVLMPDNLIRKKQVNEKTKILKYNNNKYIDFNRPIFIKIFTEAIFQIIY